MHYIIAYTINLLLMQNEGSTLSDESESDPEEPIKASNVYGITCNIICIHDIYILCKCILHDCACIQYNYCNCNVL